MELLAPRHLLVILLIALVIFGTGKLKTVGSDLGAAIRGFKKAMNAGEAEAATATPTLDQVSQSSQSTPVAPAAEPHSEEARLEGVAHK